VACGARLGLRWGTTNTKRTAARLGLRARDAAAHSIDEGIHLVHSALLAQVRVPFIAADGEAREGEGLAVQGRVHILQKGVPALAGGGLELAELRNRASNEACSKMCARVCGVCVCVRVCVKVCECVRVRARARPPHRPCPATCARSRAARTTPTLLPVRAQQVRKGGGVAGGRGVGRAGAQYTQTHPG